MNNITCSVDGCVKSVHLKGFCYGHYMKNWRYGTPTPVHSRKWEDLAGKRFGELTAVERVDGKWNCICDCGAETVARVGDLKRGSKISCGNSKLHHRSPDAGYSGAHVRVRKDRGDATNYPCVDCGDMASHWSYNHDDKDERLEMGRSAKPVAYSLDVSHYSPRCVSCHKRFDLDRIDAAKVA